MGEWADYWDGDGKPVEAVEQVLTRVLGEHEYDHLSLSGCVCGWAQRAVGATWPSEHLAHLAAELAAALRDVGHLLDPSTRIEWRYLEGATDD